MDRGILAARREHALTKIQGKTGIDLSRSALRKAPSTEIYQLFQLEKLAEELGAQSVEAIREEFLAQVQEVNGVGPALATKIRAELN